MSGFLGLYTWRHLGRGGRLQHGKACKPQDQCSGGCWGGMDDRVRVHEFDIPATYISCLRIVLSATVSMVADELYVAVCLGKKPGVASARQGY